MPDWTLRYRLDNAATDTYVRVVAPTLGEAFRTLEVALGDSRPIVALTVFPTPQALGE